MLVLRYQRYLQLSLNIFNHRHIALGFLKIQYLTWIYNHYPSSDRKRHLSTFNVIDVQL